MACEATFAGERAALPRPVRGVLGPFSGIVMPDSSHLSPTRTGAARLFPGDPSRDTTGSPFLEGRTTPLRGDRRRVPMRQTCDEMRHFRVFSRRAAAFWAIWRTCAIP